MGKISEKYENIIIGGGWSGIEVAYVLGKNKKEALLVMANIDSIGWVHNPEMNRNKKLYDYLVKNNALFPEIIKNKPAINKRWEYSKLAKDRIDALKTIKLRQDIIEGIEKKERDYILKGTSGKQYKCRNVFICAGSFLGSRLNIGKIQIEEAGRDNESASNELIKSIKKMKVKTRKGKTVFSTIKKNKENELVYKGKGTIISNEYEVEHETVDTEQLSGNFEHKTQRGMYFAGRCVGANTLEETAFSGLIAGNAVIKNIVDNVPRGTLLFPEDGEKVVK